MSLVHLLFVSFKRPLRWCTSISHGQVTGAETSLPALTVIGNVGFLAVSGHWHLAVLA